MMPYQNSFKDDGDCGMTSEEELALQKEVRKEKIYESWMDPSFEMVDEILDPFFYNHGIMKRLMQSYVKDADTCELGKIIEKFFDDYIEDKSDEST